MSEAVGLKELLRRKIDQMRGADEFSHESMADYLDKRMEQHTRPEESPHLSSATEDEEYTGGSVSYYKTSIAAPLSGNAPYVAECNDIIEALGMNYAEGNAFKAIWRMCAARTLGVKKRGYTDGLYDAEKVAFFGARMVAQQTRIAGK